MVTQVQGQDVIYTAENIVIDGKSEEKVWHQQDWLPMDKHILGDYPTAEDFSGRYKLAWDENALYLLVNIVDDVLYDRYANPLQRYWDDDCLEIFIDENHSGGDHLANFNAFAYHIALDKQVVDYAPSKDGKGKPALFNHHIDSEWIRVNDAKHSIIWEVAINIFGDNYQHDDTNFSKYLVLLNENKHMGFMLAYCDNDGGPEREHFIGSTDIAPINGDKNLGYKTADVFGKIRLVKLQGAR
jgi:hypothetical protein